MILYIYFLIVSPSVSSQLMMFVQKLITNRKVQEQQMAMANQASYLNQLVQNSMLGGNQLSQMDLLGIYQQLHGLGKNPGPSKGL